MKSKLICLVFAGSSISVTAHAIDLTPIRECLITGESILQAFESVRQMTPGVENKWVDSQVAAIRQAEAECAEKKAVANAEMERQLKDETPFRYSVVSECLVDGNRIIENLYSHKGVSPSPDAWDAEIGLVRKAQAECARRTPEERARLRALHEQKHNPKPYSGAGNFEPGGMFNPVHVRVLPGN